MTSRSIGDVILRDSMTGAFDILDGIKGSRLAGPLPLLAALTYARDHGAQNILQQRVDKRGRLLGDPTWLVRAELVYAH